MELSRRHSVAHDPFHSEEGVWQQEPEPRRVIRLTGIDAEFRGRLGCLMANTKKELSQSHIELLCELIANAHLDFVNFLFLQHTQVCTTEFSRFRSWLR